jgi:hypothetical protein
MFCWNEAMPTVIRALKARSDVHAIVAMVHWGGAVRHDQGGDRYTAAINEGERLRIVSCCPLVSETHVRRCRLQLQHQVNTNVSLSTAHVVRRAPFSCIRWP